MKKSIMQLFLYRSFYLLSIIQRYSLSNLTENVRSRLHPVSHFFFRKNIDYSFYLLLQLIDTSFLFIQHTFSLHYFKLLPILNVKIILFQQFLHTSLKKSARVCLQNNSAMHFQNLGDRFSLLSLLMIFLLIFF